MSEALNVNGVGVVSTLGIGFDAFARSLREPDVSRAEVVSSLPFSPEQELPGLARWIGDFKPAGYLGSRGISTFDRSTQFSVVASKQIIDALPVEDSRMSRTGIVLGSSGGGMKSITDFVRTTYVAARPHLVSPLQFPNTVMNCAASQCAIWHGLRGVNSTVCAGELSGLAALQYANRMLCMEHADRMIAGSVEEFCDFGAWSHHATTSPQSPPPGEGAALFDLTLSHGDIAPLAQILAIRLRNLGRHSGLVGQALAELVRNALDAAGVVPDEIRWWSPHCGAGADQREPQMEALRHGGLHVERLVRVAADLSDRVGNTYAASTSLQIAALIATAPEGIGLVTAVTDNDQTGCAVIRIPPRIKA